MDHAGVAPGELPRLGRRFGLEIDRFSVPTMLLAGGGNPVVRQAGHGDFGVTVGGIFPNGSCFGVGSWRRLEKGLFS
jgi:hypothetical protein